MKNQRNFTISLPLVVCLLLLMSLMSCTNVPEESNTGQARSDRWIEQNEANHLGEKLTGVISNAKASGVSVEVALGEYLQQNDTLESFDQYKQEILMLAERGVLNAIESQEFDKLGTLKLLDTSRRNSAVIVLYKLYPNYVAQLSRELEKRELLTKDELLHIAMHYDIDVSLVLQATASGNSEDIMHIGWGGSGAFSSVIEFDGDIYASSDVTGVWKFNGSGWTPMVAGLTNYNVTGLVEHGDALLAITKKEVLRLQEDETWSPIGLKFKSMRSTTLQLSSTSAQGVTCFAALQAKIPCIDSAGNMTSASLSIPKLKGVYFWDEEDALFGFSDRKLYRVNRFDGSVMLEKTFDKSVVRVVRLSPDAMPLVFTARGVFELGSYAAIDVNFKYKDVVNVMIDTSDRINKQHFFALGDQWNASIYKLIVGENSLRRGELVNVKYETNQPFRNWRKSITKPVGMPTSIGNSIWFTDFWGIYKHNSTSGKFDEMSLDASNFVGTDIEIDEDKLYITSMDNGLVSMDVNYPNVFTNIFPRMGSDWLHAGHVWSVTSSQDGVFATLSPWNLQEDYLLSADKSNNFLNLQKVDTNSSRTSPGAFWGQSYARKLLHVNDKLYTYKDGSNGGLYKMTPNFAGRELIESTSNKIFTTGQNRVYRAFTKLGNQLVSYHIDGQPNLKFFDLETESLVDEVTAPSGLWAFEIKVVGDDIYLLGARNGAVIYKYSSGTFSEFLRDDLADAFHSMAFTQTGDIGFAGSVSWDGNTNGKLFMRHSDEEWQNITCLLTNNSGVVDIEIDEYSGEYVYFLLQNGGIIRIKLTFLNDFSSC